MGQFETNVNLRDIGSVSLVKPELRSELPGMTNEELAAALQAGDSWAFGEVVRRFQGRVFAVAYRMTGNREDALDITQEAFIKVYRKADRWRPTSGFLPWVLQVASNQAIDYLRRQKRQRRVIQDSPVDSEDFVEKVGTEDTKRNVHAGEIDVRIREALKVLSPMQRSVFIMRHYEGLSLFEIAEALGCTTGSVKVHLFRSLKKLQSELKDFYHNGEF